MRLTIVIPAYNEEEAIADICNRTLAAKPEIIAATDISDVNIVVVSDGSHDKTAEIASGFSGIQLISYEKNKGYGAAIKLGFNAHNDELVSFLDADGTCDPLFFIKLVNELTKKEYDVILGSRMNKDSSMPMIRRVGNVMFATLLNLLSGNTVKDTASGMRIIKRSALDKLYPLPDGLHFTPAMSAKAIFNKNLSIGEVPMPYEERVGESKLNPWKDGLRFLRVIIETSLQYRPNIFLNATGLLFILVAILLSFTPVAHLLKNNTLEEGMIYRNLTSFVLINAGMLLFVTGQNAQSFLRLIYYRNNPEIFFEKKNSNRSALHRHGLLFGLICLVVSGFLLIKPFSQLIKTGHIQTDWWVFLAGELFFLLAFVFISAGAMGVVLKLLALQLVDQREIKSAKKELAIFE